MSKPVAIGPPSRTVIGESPQTVSDLLRPKEKSPWKRLFVPMGIVGAIYLAMRYKGHV